MSSELEHSPNLESSPKIVSPSSYVTSDRIGTIKRVYILSLAAISLAGCGVAGYQAFTTGVGWLELNLFLLMSALSAVGITVGFHRYFTHKTFDAHPIVKIILAILGSMAGEGSIVAWVSVHRCHHQYTDVVGDPHSPHLHGDSWLNRLYGFWYSHLGWLMDNRLPNSAVFAKDLIRDPVILTINRLYPLWIFLGILIPGLLGWSIAGNGDGFFRGLIWGGVARLFFSFNGGYTINSIAHTWGNRMFTTQDFSTNNFWLAIPTFGEGWHNNHHAFPNSAKLGLKWWQIDLGFVVIQLLELMGLVENVQQPSPDAISVKEFDRISLEKNR
jgi:stearoyl-CoA desaturase (Delta-9 desaturase)